MLNTGVSLCELHANITNLILHRYYAHAAEGEQRFEMDLSNLEPGIYFCKTGADGKEKVVKVMKQ